MERRGHRDYASRRCALEGRWRPARRRDETRRVARARAASVGLERLVWCGMNSGSLALRPKSALGAWKPPIEPASVRRLGRGGQGVGAECSEQVMRRSSGRRSSRVQVDHVDRQCRQIHGRKGEVWTPESWLTLVVYATSNLRRPPCTSQSSAPAPPAAFFAPRQRLPRWRIEIMSRTSRAPSLGVVFRRVRWRSWSATQPDCTLS